MVEYAVRETAKKELTTEAYKKAYETYTPTMAAQVIALDSEETAKSVLEELKAEGADFAAIAKEKQQQQIRKLLINLIQVQQVYQQMLLRQHQA